MTIKQLEKKIKALDVESRDVYRIYEKLNRQETALRKKLHKLLCERDGHDWQGPWGGMPTPRMRRHGRLTCRRCHERCPREVPPGTVS